jgi:protein TonB
VTSLQLEAIHPDVITGNDVASVETVPSPLIEFDELTPAISQPMKRVLEQDAVETAPLTPSEDVVARAVPTPLSPVQQRLVRGVTAQYAGVLKGWLQRNMRYPRDAWLDGQQGTAIVLFTIGRDGNVITSRLEHSSGYKVLDGEAMQMVRRADPFPAMPPEIVGNELELRVPIVFYIKDYERPREMPPIYLK